MDKSKLSLPISILLASIILGGFLYAIQVNKQQSIEGQQEIKRRQACYDKREYNTKFYYDEKSGLCRETGRKKTLEAILQ